ncbi:regulator of Vps4 activity in the MVB pathway-domain-containing protein [Scleroderma citrinum]
MANPQWDPAAFKACTLLKTTSYHLTQLRERKASQSQITRRDIATLLNAGDTGLARTKAQNLMRDETIGGVLEVLEMCIGMVHARVGEFEADKPGKALSPPAIEAASTIIYAAPSIESKDINVVRDVLVHRLGRAFAHSALTNSGNTVSPQVIDMLTSPAPTVAQMDNCLANIASAYDVKWTPEPRRQDILDQLSEVLDSESSPVVDLVQLRKLCSRGVPDDPPWIRPRLWRLFFGTLPVLKRTWEKESRKQREAYYDLVRRLLPPLGSLPPPSSPLSLSDAAILKVSESLFHLPSELFSLLEEEPESHSLCPLDEAAEGNIKIDCARNIDTRLQCIRKDNTEPGPPGIPEIRLEPEIQHVPLEPSGLDTSLEEEEVHSTTLVQAKPFDAPPAHRKHLSALLRLLFLHSCLNPANQAPHISALLVPLYSVLTREIDPIDAAHAEADTFWLFEALVGEFVELEDEQGGKVWMQRFSERLSAADSELAENLHAKSLDPALPHYSYRWLATLLTQTLPLDAVFPVWDVIFACPMRTRDSNPKLDCLVDICVGLLIRARTPLFRLGKPGGKTAGLWTHEHAALPPLSPLRPWELSDAFMEGMALLQTYPIQAAGGIDRILQTASDISQKRMKEAKAHKTESLTLGARFKASVWKGFATPLMRTDDKEEEPDEDETEVEDMYDDGNETETPAAQSLTSRLATTVWRGITNQSSMDDEIPSPPTPPSGLPSPPKVEPKSLPTQPVQTTLWDYAGKLKDSDTVAAFSKVSTNWRAKAMNAWSSRRGSNVSSGSALDMSSPRSVTSELPPPKSAWPSISGARMSSGSPHQSSFPNSEIEDAVNPPRPVFRSPRESFLPQPRRQPFTAPSSPEYSNGEGAFMDRTKVSLASLASLQMRSAPAAKSGPRPLLLNSQTLMTASKSQSPANSDGGTPPIHRQGQWADVHLSKSHVMRQESMSSTSSLSLPDTFNKPYSRSAGSRSDYDSDGNSRRVPLNRKSVSPMALASRSPRVPWVVPSSAHSSDTSISSTLGHPLASGIVAEKTPSERGWTVHTPDSPTIIPSPPNLLATINPSTSTPVRVNGVDRDESMHTPLEPPMRSGVIIRKRTPPPVRSGNETGDTSDSSLSHTPSKARVRSKRYVTRPANLRIRDALRPNMMVVEQQKSVSPRGSLAPEWPEEQELTPRADNFGGGDPSSASTTSPVSPRRSPSGKVTDGSRKGLGDNVRTRKTSTGSREVRRNRDSGAEEGDDEGYDELLSAYESEEGSRE